MHVMVNAPGDVMVLAKINVQVVAKAYVIQHVQVIAMTLALLITKLKLEILGALRQTSLLKSEIIGEAAIKYI